MYSMEDYLDGQVDYQYRIDANLTNLTLPLPKTDELCITFMDSEAEITGDYEEVVVEEDTYAIIKGDCTIKASGGTPT